MAHKVDETEPRSLEEVRTNLQSLLATYNAPDRSLDGDVLEALARWIRDH